MSYIKKLQRSGLQVDAAYLFGSYAKGTQRRGSDIDICIVSPELKEFCDNVFYLNSYATNRYIEKIEAIGFSPTDFADPGWPLVNNVKRTGIRLL